MNREKVISREYKLVLKTENFSGQEKELLNKASMFWKDCKKAIEPVIKSTDGGFDAINTRREIRFYDTKALEMHNMNYIFRERKGISNDKREVTLKFRHPDRYLSQDRDMLARKIGKG